MNYRDRNRGQKKSEPSGPRFCSRCGGATSSQPGGVSTNVCRCTTEQRRAYEPEAKAVVVVEDEKPS
jgi:hypothetical protein